MRRFRSEDSATGKAERDRINLRRHVFRMTQLQAGALAQGQCDATQVIYDLRQLEDNVSRIH